MLVCFQTNMCWSGSLEAEAQNSAVNSTLNDTRDLIVWIYDNVTVDGKNIPVQTILFMHFLYT